MTATTHTAIAPTRTAQPTVSTAPRVTYMDNLRVVLTALVIIFHTAITYGAEGGWYYKEPTDDMAAIIPLTMFVAIMQSFFMGLFFLIAGYFTPASVDKKGSGKYIVDRLVRLGIPLLVFVYLLNPLTNVIVDGLIIDIPLAYGYGVGTMWFVQALLIFGVAYALLRLAAPARPDANLASDFPKTWQFIALIAFIAAATILVRNFYPRGTGMFGMAFGDFPQYIPMFIVGTIAYRRRWLESLDQASTRILSGALAILLIALPLMMVFGEDPVHGFEPFMGGLYWQAIVYAIWESCMAIVMNLLMLKWFQNRFTGQSPLMQSLSSSAYTTYIIHPVTVVLGSALLLTVPAHPLLKFVLLSVTATTATFWLAGQIKRLPGANHVL